MQRDPEPPWIPGACLDPLAGSNAENPAHPEASDSAGIPRAACTTVAAALARGLASRSRAPQAGDSQQSLLRLRDGSCVETSDIGGVHDAQTVHLVCSRTAILDRRGDPVDRDAHAEGSSKPGKMMLRLGRLFGTEPHRAAHDERLLRTRERDVEHARAFLARRLRSLPAENRSIHVDPGRASPLSAGVLSASARRPKSWGASSRRHRDRLPCPASSGTTRSGTRGPSTHGCS